jgi:2-C-methyl-D-erythritol 4-phosphate cytidylyltransferase
MSVSSSDSSSPERSAAAIIVAGGSGKRIAGAMGGVRKQYLEVGGVPVLLRAIRPFLEHPDIHQVVVVLPGDDVENPPAWLTETRVALVAGGAERGDSVWNGLSVLGDRANLVLVHDGARPFVSTALIDRVLHAAGDGGAVPAMPATDTVKESTGDGLVVRTLDRSRLWNAQTPQGFDRRLLVSAYQRARREAWSFTDDASVVERAGFPVRLVTGAPENLKITRPEDLEIAELIARRSNTSA